MNKLREAKKIVGEHLKQEATQALEWLRLSQEEQERKRV